jgi:hypothetical protein
MSLGQGVIGFGRLCGRAFLGIGRRFVLGRPDEVVLHDYPGLVLATPFILIGYLVWILQRYGLDGSGHVTGWLYLTTMVVTLLTMSVDISRTQAVVAMLAAGFVVLLSYFLSTAFQFTMLGSLGRWFFHLAPAHPGDFALAASFVLSIAWVIMYVHVRLNRRWTISSNGIFHHEVLKQDTDYRMVANAVRIEFPNALAQLLLGAGTIRVPGLPHIGIPPAEIQHIPFLTLKRRKLLQILESINVTQVASTAATPISVAAPQPLAS